MKTASYFKRFLAFIIDLLFVGIIMLIMGYLIPDSAKINLLIEEQNYLVDLLASGKIAFARFFEEISNTALKLDIARLRFNLVNLIILISYFCFVPFYNKGKTFGMNFLDIKTVKTNKNKITPFEYIIKAFLLLGMLYSVFTILIMFFIPAKVYLTLTLIVFLIQILMVIVNAFMVIYRKDKLGFVDILTKTKIVDERK